MRVVRIRTNKGVKQKQKETSPRDLIIGTYNIAHGRGSGPSNWKGGGREERRRRLTEIARFLKKQDPDVVVLNEVDFRSVWSHNINQVEIIAREAGFPYWVEQRNFDLGFPFFCLCFGNAVLSRFPINEAVFVDFPAFSRLENLAAGKKNGVLCTICLPNGEEIRLLAVHLEYRSEPIRVKSAGVINRLREGFDQPLICAGDFNSSPEGYPESELDENGRSALGVLLQTGELTTLPEGKPVPSDYTFPSKGPTRVIDWILVPKSWEILSKEVPAVPWSDHLPVFLRVRIK